jgi:hypothetical protein
MPIERTAAAMTSRGQYFLQLEMTVVGTCGEASTLAMKR